MLPVRQKNSDVPAVGGFNGLVENYLFCLAGCTHNVDALLQCNGHC